METDTILSMLANAGFRIRGVDGQFIYIEDPSCILRSFSTFAEYAWIALTCVTGLLLFGWAISMIRGAKNDIFTNSRNLILILGIAAAAIPIINTIYGKDLFKAGCKTVEVSIESVQQLLSQRASKLPDRNNTLYEEFDIYDTGAIIPEACEDCDNLVPIEIPDISIETPPENPIEPAAMETNAATNL